MLWLARGRLDQVNTPSPPPAQLCSCSCLLTCCCCRAPAASTSECAASKRGSLVRRVFTSPRSSLCLVGVWVCLGGSIPSCEWLTIMAGLRVCLLTGGGMAGSICNWTNLPTHFDPQGRSGCMQRVPCLHIHLLQYFGCSTRFCTSSFPRSNPSKGRSKPGLLIIIYVSPLVP